MVAGVILAFSLMLSRPIDLRGGICTVDFLNIEEHISIQEPEVTLEKWEIDILAKCVESEAGDQGYLGKCYVVDVILNRMEQWNLTCEEVIFQRHQFEVVSNGRIWKMHPPEETYQAIRDELMHRTNREIIYFRMDYYHSFGTPLFSYKDHYFSK